MQMQQPNDFYTKRPSVAFTVTDEDSSHENISPMRGFDPSKGRRRRSERTKLKDEEMARTCESVVEIKHVNTMDQFANFLISKQSFVKDEDSEEEVQVEQEDGEEKLIEEEEEEAEVEYQPNELEIEEEQAVVREKYKRLGEEMDKEMIYANDTFQEVVEVEQLADPKQIIQDTEEEEEEEEEEKEESVQNKSQLEVTEKQKSQSDHSEHSENHQDKHDMVNTQKYYQDKSKILESEPISLRESPIKGSHHMDSEISYLQKEFEATTNMFNQKCQFSPDSTHINVITPKNQTKTNNHFVDYEINYNDDSESEANRSNFRETIKSQSTDIRSALADLDNINANLRRQDQTHNPNNRLHGSGEEKQEGTEHNSFNLTPLNLHQNEPDKNYMLLQYEYVLQQMNEQVQKLLARNQELEQANVSNDLLKSQSTKIIQELQAQILKDKLAYESRIELMTQAQQLLESELEKHKQILQIYSAELEMARQNCYEAEQRMQLAQQNQFGIHRNEQELRALFEEQVHKCRQLEQLCVKKDEDIFKLKQDNSNLFMDLKKYAHIEESHKLELMETRNKRQESEQVMEDLKERCQIQEQKLRNFGIENEKTKRELQITKDQAKMMERTIDDMRQENDELRDKLAHIETERINWMSERERKDREVKNMQAEISRFNSLIATYKTMQSNQDFSSYNSKPQQTEQTVSWLNQEQPYYKNDRQVFKNSDINKNSNNQYQENGSMWPSQNKQPYQEQAQYDSRPQTSMAGDFSPMKKTDPNAPYAQRAKLIQKQAEQSQINTAMASGYFGVTLQQNQQQRQAKSPLRQQPNYGQQQFNNIQMLQNTLQSLLSDKQRMESEYQKIPITIHGKSMQLKKRKEELEFELDLLEKNIAQVSLKIKDCRNGPTY